MASNLCYFSAELCSFLGHADIRQKILIDLENIRLERKLCSEPAEYQIIWSQ